MTSEPILGRDLRSRLTARRTELGLNQRQLAERMGTSQSHVCELEKSKKDPSLATLAKWTSALGVTFRIQIIDSYRVVR